MSKLIKTVVAQKPLMAEFTYLFDDTMVNTAAAEVAFKTIGTPAFDIIDLPVNSVVVGGEIVVETAFATSTLATMSLGDSSSTTRYSTTLDLKTAARTAIGITGFRNSSGLAIRGTFNVTAADSTAGKVTVRVLYIIKDRADERM